MHIPCISLMRTDLSTLKLHHICLLKCKALIRQTNLIKKMLKDPTTGSENICESALSKMRIILERNIKHQI